MERLLYRLADGPAVLMWGCLATAAALAWFYLAAADGGVVAALCNAREASPGAILAMWLAMAFAMMLPSAAPMIAAYMDIAAAARAKSIAAVPVLVLVSGYIAVWIGFSLCAAALQFAMQGLTANRFLQAGLLILAGLYQFAPLKHACLTKCRRPMPYFLARWSDLTSAVFRMGLEQGALCLGCCWALMLLALGAGAMNPAWMAALTILMILEKTLPQPKALVYGLGIGLSAAGVALAIGGTSWPS